MRQSDIGSDPTSDPVEIPNPDGGAFAMLEPFLAAKALRDTVEGNPGGTPVEIKDGVIHVLWGKFIAEGAVPQPELLATVLRSEIDLTPQLRATIADFIALEGASAFHFTRFKRRKGSRPAAPFDFDTAIWIAKEIKEAKKYESGIEAAMTKFGISRATATNLVRELREFAAEARKNDDQFAVVRETHTP